VNLDHLQLFRDIAQTRSISRAAQLNAVSQSAASQHLQELERLLDIQLVDRSIRPLVLTPAGRLYQEFCREVLRLRQQFDVEMEGLKGQVEGLCRVASIYSVGLSEMSGLEVQFSARFPDAELKVEYLRPEKVYEAVVNDRADLGLVSYPEATKDVKVTPWREERMVVAMAPIHPLALKTMIHTSDLDGLDFVGFDDELPVSKEVKRFLRDAGVEVRQVLHFDNIQMMKEAVANAKGVSILPEPILQREIEQGRLTAVPLEAPGLKRPLGILQPRRKKLNRATQSFLHLLVGGQATLAG
jgi:DNA-binding transcriptional LysR family regulator